MISKKNKINFKFLFLIINLLIANVGHTTATNEIFKKHWNPIFIETGCYIGEGIENALEAGFIEIHSIELSDYYYQYCVNQFHHHSYVHLYHGDSSIMMKSILKDINQRSTFWLDGHYSGTGTAKGETNTPLLTELAIIAEHPIKDHTILIDDIRLLGTEEFDFITLENIINIIKKINPDYEISYENGHVENDILVAEIRSLAK